MDFGINGQLYSEVDGHCLTCLVSAQVYCFKEKKLVEKTFILFVTKYFGNY